MLRETPVPGQDGFSPGLCAFDLAFVERSLFLNNEEALRWNNLLATQLAQLPVEGFGSRKQVHKPVHLVGCVKGRDSDSFEYSFGQSFEDGT